MRGNSPQFEELSGGEARLRILTNLALNRVVKAKAVWKKEAIEKKMDRILLIILLMLMFIEQLQTIGIMNGIDAVVIATGNDFRATEAACHAYAS